GAASATVLLLGLGVGRLGRHELVARRGGAVGLLPGTAIEPLVRNDAVRPRRTAGVDGGVSRPGERVGVGIMAVFAPRPLVAEATKAFRAEEFVPATQVIAPQLVEDQDDRQPHAGRSVLARLIRWKGCRRRDPAAEQQRERPAEVVHER